MSEENSQDKTTLQPEENKPTESEITPEKNGELTTDETTNELQKDTNNNVENDKKTDISEEMPAPQEGNNAGIVEASDNVGCDYVTEEKERIRQTKENLLTYLRECLGIVEYATAKAGISDTTFYRYYRDDPDFKAAVDEIRNVDQPRKVEMKLLKAIDSDNMSAIIFYLKSRHPDYKQKIGLEGSLDVNTKYDRLSDEQIKERIRELAGELGEQGGKEIPPLG